MEASIVKSVFVTEESIDQSKPIAEYNELVYVFSVITARLNPSNLSTAL